MIPSSVFFFVTTFIFSLSAHGTSHLFKIEHSQSYATVKFQDGKTLILSANDSKQADSFLKVSEAALADQSFDRMHQFFKWLTRSLSIQFKDGLKIKQAGGFSILGHLSSQLATLPAAEQQSIFQAAFVQSVHNFVDLPIQNIETMLTLAALGNPKTEEALLCDAMAVTGYVYKQAVPEASTLRPEAIDDFVSDQRRARHIATSVRGILKNRPHLAKTRCHVAYYEKGYFNFSVEEILIAAAKPFVTPAGAI